MPGRNLKTTVTLFLTLSAAYLLTGCTSPGHSMVDPAKTEPALSWTTPAAVTVGTVLSATQLNATANVPGTFTYSPVAGTALKSAGTVALSVTFTPTDTTAYAIATLGVSLTVNASSAPPPPPSTVATPVFSPAPGTFSSTQQVSLSTTTSGATIYYTTDGSAPSTSSTEFTGPIAVNATTVIEALAVASGETNSGMARGDYVITTSSGTGPVIPADAIAVSQIQALPDWHFKHDPGTKGSSTGAMALVSDPALSDQAAEFKNTFQNWGGEIYTKSWDNDPDAQNFVYDGYVWIQTGSIVGNLEMDNNQVMSNGDTIIYSFQCAGDSKTWDYGSNAGTAKHPNVKWVHSKQPCNPASWTRDTWHHVQISYSRDDIGNITFHSVWLDGVEAPINETVFGAFSLGWAKGDLMTNFQVDGAGSSGASTLYLDNLTFYRW